MKSKRHIQDSLNRQDILVNRDILDGIVRTQQRRIEIPVEPKTIPNVVRDVETVVSGLLKRANINAHEFPMEIGTEVNNAPAVLHIPIAKCRSGAIMPYGGNFSRGIPCLYQNR